MSWTQIKHAVNSTLGTEDFKPLDKIITSSWKFTYKTGDTTIASVTSALNNIGTRKYQFEDNFKFKYSGMLNFSISLPNVSTNQKFTITVTETESNETFTNSFTTSQNGDSNIGVTVPVTLDGIYSVAIELVSGGYNVTNITGVKFRGTLNFIPDFVESV